MAHASDSGSSGLKSVWRCGLWAALIVAFSAALVPAGALAQGAYYRLQLKHGGQYLDAAYCGNRLGLNPGSDWEGGACQLWRLVAAGGGWSRLQLKHGNQFLDADHCGASMGLNPGSDWEGGACQLWRLVPERSVRID